MTDFRRPRSAEQNDCDRTVGQQIDAELRIAFLLDERRQLFERIRQLRMVPQPNDLRELKWFVYGAVIGAVFVLSMGVTP